MASSYSDPSIDSDFPNAKAMGYSVTSCKSGYYNCIAWALGKSNNKWWPLQFKTPGWYWPRGIRCDESVQAFVEMFAKEGGYEEWGDENGNLEPGYEKIAIYANKSGATTHAARQLEDGKWASKMGHANKDIQHESPEVLESSATVESVYGRVVKYLRRKRQDSPIPPPCRLNPPPHCKLAALAQKRP